MSFDHANHNFDLCQELFKEKKYNDWVVTTAFYSSLHYVQNEIFPFSAHGEDYTCFNDYYNKKIKNRQTKHEATCQLVSRHLTSCGPAYRKLHSDCSTARYRDYQVSDSAAKQAKEDLDFIKSRLRKLEENGF